MLGTVAEMLVGPDGLPAGPGRIVSEELPWMNARVSLKNLAISSFVIYMLPFDRVYVIVVALHFRFV